MKYHSHALWVARRRIPFFPLIPLVPLAVIIANATALIALFRRVHRLEARARAARIT